MIICVLIVVLSIGSWHDAQICRPLFTKLIEETPEPYAIAGDSAFPHHGLLFKKIVTCMKEDNEYAQVSSQLMDTRRALHNYIVYIRQAAEWGMGALQKTWGCLQLPLPTDNEARSMLLMVVLRLHNYRVCNVGYNQIRSVYKDHLQHIAETWDNFTFDKPLE